MHETTLLTSTSWNYIISVKKMYLNKIPFQWRIFFIFHWAIFDQQYAVKAQTSLAPLSSYAKTAVANEIDYEIDDAWTNIHGIRDNGHVITACDVWL